MNYYCGIDIGSTTTELVVINEDKQLIYSDCKLTAGNVKETSRVILENFLKSKNMSQSDLTAIVATGYGRKFIDLADKNVTEISCYAKGSVHINADIRTIIDIGGQDSKVISVNPKGEVNDFVMNDKCAAGTGRFLEMIARIFDIELEDLGPMALQSNHTVPISSICAVFAESEVISLISQDISRQDIINSIHYSIGEKINGMAHRLSIEDEIMFCGGVAANQGMVRTIGELFECEPVIPDNVEIVGALGAALIGIE